MMTCADELAFVRSLLADFPYEIELDWINDDTTYDIEIVTDKNAEREKEMISIMESNGYRLIDSDNDTHVNLYWFG